MKSYLIITILLAFLLTSTVPTPVTAASVWSHGDSHHITNRVSEQTITSYIRQLEQLLAELRAHQAQQRDGLWRSRPGSGLSDVTVTTRAVDNIEDDRATLRGRVSFGTSDEAVVYFRWGTSPDRLTNETPNIVLDERDDQTFTARLDDLDDGRRYYYQAIAEDEWGKTDYGTIISFRADNEWNDDDDDDKDLRNGRRPEVETLGARNIRTSSAEVRGEVDMNNFENGYVFLVYGEDEDMVDEITDEYDEYDDIDTAEDDLQKTAIYSGLNTSRSFWIGIGGLDEDTDIYYTYCVAYEDSDEDESITCGDTESFTTDED